MSNAANTPDGQAPPKRCGLYGGVPPRTVPGVVALAFSLSLGGWILAAHPTTTAQLGVAVVPAKEASPRYVALLDPGFSFGFAPGPLIQRAAFEPGAAPGAPAPAVVALSEPPGAAAAPPGEPEPRPMPAVGQAAENVPLPMPRPWDVRLRTRPERGQPGRQMAQRPSGAPVVAADNRTFLQKLFGMPQTTGPVLAYAAPDAGALGSSFGFNASPAQSYDRVTAVYDIAAHTVTLPNGQRLEAHSGLGERLDDPRYVSERNRGATPPNVYELTPREDLFHGVRALRLTPVGNGRVFGRTGLLAHSFMLGAKGDSNGCVSFRNYDQFLQAYMRGEVKRLAVVARQS